ncbi:hypothetical protein JCM19301_2983 [Jejuia pallidilutea]|uniref:Uncharacterized protein n=1 Tax=Jejuia pallidilutea TaxID=504487 RepID=A0A090VP62_9FLAO|nr:hypothetical protein JCM19301_2983 [Jejuia pallidilutea]
MGSAQIIKIKKIQIISGIAACQQARVKPTNLSALLQNFSSSGFIKKKAAKFNLAAL